MRKLLLYHVLGVWLLPFPDVLVSSLSTATFCKPTLVLPGLITDRPPVIGTSHASSGPPRSARVLPGGFPAMGGVVVGERLRKVWKDTRTPEAI